MSCAFVSIHSLGYQSSKYMKKKQIRQPAIYSAYRNALQGFAELIQGKKDNDKLIDRLQKLVGPTAIDWSELTAGATPVIGQTPYAPIKTHRKSQSNLPTPTKTGSLPKAFLLILLESSGSHLERIWELLEGLLGIVLDVFGSLSGLFDGFTELFLQVNKPTRKASTNQPWS